MPKSLFNLNQGNWGGNNYSNIRRLQPGQGANIQGMRGMPGLQPIGGMGQGMRGNWQQPRGMRGLPPWMQQRGGMRGLPQWQQQFGGGQQQQRQMMPFMGMGGFGRFGGFGQ